MRITSAKELESVLRLDGPARFKHFVKRVVDDESAWGLWKDGWGLMADDDAKLAFPLWPAKEYAELCRTGNWSEYSVEQIPLETLLNDILPRMSQERVLPAIFPTPGGKGVTPSVEELIQALEEESLKYE
jgi:hypothetical protein